jgi:23S rRNA (adenine2503-C2)-methyltransferase
MNKVEIDNKSLVGMDLIELESIVLEFDHKKFRSVQIFNWIYGNNVQSIDEMRNIPIQLRSRLKEKYLLNPMSVIDITGDGNTATQKYLLKCSDGKLIESVLMTENNRTTMCLSSQIGCALDCKFCATGTMGIIRNLTVGEIVGQYLQISKESNKTITNVVFMGMGEPFLNYENVIDAAALLNHSDGINIGARHITISTAGILPGIKKFIDEKQRYRLAISLNSSNQKHREKIMPIAKKYNLDDLIDAAWTYYNSTKNFVTFEYVLMANENDTKDDAMEIIKLIDNLPCKLNIIPYNEINGSIKRPGIDKINSFLNYFNNVPFTVTTRWSKGNDIDAGCGQLVLK